MLVFDNSKTDGNSFGWPQSHHQPHHASSSSASRCSVSSSPSQLCQCNSKSLCSLHQVKKITKIDLVVFLCLVPQEKIVFLLAKASPWTCGLLPPFFVYPRFCFFHKTQRELTKKRLFVANGHQKKTKTLPCCLNQDDKMVKIAQDCPVPRRMT